VLVDKTQRQRIVTESRRPGFLLLFAVLAERDDLRVWLLALEIHMRNPLVPTVFAAGVIIVRCFAPTFVRPAHAAASCSSRRPKRRKTPQSANCSTA